MTLDSLGLIDGDTLHVVDTDPSSMVNQLGNAEANAPKYELDEKSYDQRDDTFRAMIRKGAIQCSCAAKPEITPELLPKVGDRCEIDGDRRGTVRYVGAVSVLSPDGSAWVGIELDEPLGKNDGTCKGKRYFTCNPNYGVFLRPDKVKVGDYPVDELI